MCQVIDAKEFFSNAASNLMGKFGIGYDTCSKEVMHEVMRECAECESECWSEFYLWAVRQIMEQAEKKLLTRALLREQIRLVR